MIHVLYMLPVLPRVPVLPLIPMLATIPLLTKILMGNTPASISATLEKRVYKDETSQLCSTRIQKYKSTTV